MPAKRAVVFCVGNRLMLDEGVGPAVYDMLLTQYDIPSEVEVFDVGCMSLDMLHYIDSCDLVVSVDAVDGTDHPPGTVLRFKPEDMARNTNVISSLHELKLADLFDRAALLGYEAEGVCLGMQVENSEPADYVIGLTTAVAEALPLLAETVVAELDRHGFHLEKRKEPHHVSDPWA